MLVILHIILTMKSASCLNSLTILFNTCVDTLNEWSFKNLIRKKTNSLKNILTFYWTLILSKGGLDTHWKKEENGFIGSFLKLKLQWHLFDVFISKIKSNVKKCVKKSICLQIVIRGLSFSEENSLINLTIYKMKTGRWFT